MADYNASDKSFVPPTITDMKNVLIQEYDKYSRDDSYNTNVVNTLYLEGKQNTMANVRAGTITLENTIMHSGYYLTILDIWALVKYYDLPLILLSSSFIKINYKKLVILNTTANGVVYFVKINRVLKNTIPTLSLIRTSEGLLHKLLSLEKTLISRIIGSRDNKLTIQHYIQSSVKSGYEQRQRRQLEIKNLKQKQGARDKI
jgi:hypothetical protein